MDYNLPYKVSGNNVYIYGYAVECDLLILKQDSKAIFEAPEIYRAEDVITIIESKATGIFIDKKKPKNHYPVIQYQDHKKHVLNYKKIQTTNTPVQDLQYVYYLLSLIDELPQDKSILIYLMSKRIFL